MLQNAISTDGNFGGRRVANFAIASLNCLFRFVFLETFEGISSMMLLLNE